MNETFVGIDIASKKIDVYIDSIDKHLTLERSQEGIDKLIEYFQDLNISLVVMEATGGYESFVACTLNALNYHVSVTNPRKVRNYARALGKLAKTDEIDSKILASFARNVQPMKSSFINKEHVKLKKLVRRRNDLLLMLRMERNHLYIEEDTDLQENIHDLLDTIEDKLNEVEIKIQEIININEKLSTKAALIESMPGAGKVLSSTLLAELPELGMLSEIKVTALVGLAPYNCDSGLMRGKRKIFGGRSKVREVLYMFSLVAIRHNPKIQKFYQKLCSNAKPKKVAIVACMRKILLTLNSMIKNSQTWILNYFNT